MEARSSPAQQLPVQYMEQLDPSPERSRALPGPYSGLQHGIQQLWQTQDLESDRRLVKTPRRVETLPKAAAEG